MKKIVLGIAVISSLLFSEVIRKSDKHTEKENDRISYTGTIYNTEKNEDYTVLTIATKEHGRIKAKVERTSFKEDDKVEGSCSDYEYGIYNNCSIFRK